jgi:hypothetical protein
MEEAMMKLIYWIGTAVLAVGVLGGTANTASAQSDRTMGINCTVAGHIHCGENGPVGGSARWHHRHYRHYRHVERMSRR